MKSILISGLFLFISFQVFELSALKNIEASNRLFQIGEPSKQALNPNHIEVLVWNMLKAKCDGKLAKGCQTKTWSQDFHKLVKEKDIVLTQETILAPKMTKHYKSENQFLWNFAKAYTLLFSRKPTGVTTGTRTESNTLPVALRSPISDDEASTGKKYKLMYKSMMFTYHKIFGSEKELLSINIHAFNNPLASPEDYFKHIDQARSYIESHDGPVIFAGDFNTFDETPERLEYLKEVLINQMGFKKVPLKNESDLYFEKNSFGYSGILDHAFIKGLKLLDSQVYGPSCKICSVGSSDHKPFSMVFKVISKAQSF